MSEPHDALLPQTELEAGGSLDPFSKTKDAETPHAEGSRNLITYGLSALILNLAVYVLPPTTTSVNAVINGAEMSIKPGAIQIDRKRECESPQAS